jgi:hypothetical protein
VQILESDLEIYDRARDAHMDLNHELAQQLYVQVIATTSSMILKDQARFASGMSAYDAKNYAVALKTFRERVMGEKDSAWQISARRMEAESLIKLVRVKEALVILDSIGTAQSKVRAYLIKNEHQVP